MTDYDNKDLNRQEPMNDQAPETAAPETPVPETPAPETPEAGAPAPYTAPDPSSTPHLTLEPDPQPPVEPIPEEPAPAGDPFQMPEPPRAPEPPAYQQTAPNYTQPPQYAPPQYSAPQYQPQQPNYAPVYNVPPAGYVQKSRLAAGLLALLFGTFGVHNYYLGFNTRATVQLIVALAGGLLTCGIATGAVAIWGFVEGILILSASPSRLYDGNNVILRD